MNLTQARELAADFTGGKPFEPANEVPALIAYRLQVKEGAQVRLSFDVMATSKVAAQKQHEVLCEPGEQVVVYTQAEWEAKRFQPRTLTPMGHQHRQNDVDMVLNRGCGL